MSIHYYPHMEAVGCIFGAALSLYLIRINKRTDTVRASYLRCLFAVTAAGFLDVLLRVLMNADQKHLHIDFPLTALYSLVCLAELYASANFVLYALDQADAKEQIRKRMGRVLQIFSALFIQLQVLNLFAHFSHRIDSDGAIVRGPLYVLFVYCYPVLYFLAGFAVFFVYRKAYSRAHATVIFCSLLITVCCILCQGLFFPRVPLATFGASVSVFLLYFSLETPPFLELQARLLEVEQAEKLAEKEKQHALLEDRGMNEFLANMSHEIRTPLTAILGYDEVVLNRAKEEDVREYARDILSAGQTLLYIVGDILDFSKIESGQLALSVGEYHLKDMLDNLDNMIRKKARDKGIEYRTDIDKDIPDLLIGDGIRVSQILLNVLNNAVKYTPHGYAQLKLRAKSEPDDETLLLLAEIEDSGIGIRQEDMGKLFGAFLRIDEERNTGVEGTGLGLAITSRLLELMHGTIEAESTYGKGSVFRITIPQRIASRETIGMREEEAQESFGAAGEELFAPEARMLVVDDNLTNRTVVGELLKQTLIRIDMADSGEHCLEMVRQIAYDIILLDQMMPRLSGPETLRKMKEMGEQNKSAQAAVIAFTADAIAGARERLIGQGFHDYVSKPVSLQTLVRTIRRNLSEDKLLHSGTEAYEIAKEEASVLSKSETEKTKEQKLLEQLTGIDLAQALSVCGTKEVLLAAVRDFYDTIESQADLIERYMEEGDIKNYTIKVHALKSAANFIGARTLSDDAAYLERMGNRENTEEIKEKTPALLTLYRSYLERLLPIDADAQNPDAPEIEREELFDAYEEIRLFAEDFDFDGADAVIKTLSSYRIPEGERARYKKIRLAVTNVDREGLLALLQEENG